MTQTQDRQSHNLSVFDGGGDGRPVVLISGWPLSHTSWSAQTEALTDAGYRVVTYDRRGFGKSDPGDSYDYDALTDDLANVIDDLDLTDVTLVGFSMGGGEVARYVSRHGQDRLRSVVFAASISPALLESDSNPDGPLDEDSAKQMRKDLENDRDAFFEEFSTNFFSAHGELEGRRREAPGDRGRRQAVGQGSGLGVHGRLGHRLPQRHRAGHRPGTRDPRRRRRDRAAARDPPSAPTTPSRAASWSSSRTAPTASTPATRESSTRRC